MIEKISIMSMNCRGLSDLKKRRDVMHYIRSKNFSIVLLQDTHLTVSSIPYFDSLWNGKAYHSCLTSRSRGASILINSNLQYSLIAEQASVCGNFQIVACKILNESYLLVSVYGPNEDNPAFYKNLSNIIDQFDVQYTIVAGDFNFVIDPNSDSLHYAGEYNVLAKQEFLKLSYEHSLIDIWRHMFHDERRYTWFRRNPFKAGRLDMFFISDSMINAVTETDIKPGYRTDHNIITLSFQSKQTRGNGLWKFNTSHLTDEDYRKTVRDCITQTLKQYAVPVYDDELYKNYKHYQSIKLTISDTLFYETLIMLIRGETVKFSKQKARQKRANEAKLERDIARAENELVNSPQQEQLIHLTALKNELEELRAPMIEGLIVRSRVAWHEKGERSSKYFLSLEKRNACRKSIQYIQTGDNIITDNTKIIDAFSDIFQRKYSLNADIIPDSTFIAKHITKRLDATDKNRLDAEISMSELTNALNSMKKGKTPGSNGFPVEFFRCFWLELSPFLYRAVQKSLTEGNELLSHREGIITLIPKKGKSPNTFKGWRPISLLNADYKIISTVMANRLKTVMSKLINPAQTAYTSGRYIGENTRLLYDVIHWTNGNKKPGVVLAADFEAAFESIAWNYLRSIFNELNFGPNFKHMINHLYLSNQNYSRILLNGYLGKRINMESGIRQGDPASGYLFNLAVSLLTEQVSKSTMLTGIKLDSEHEIRISQYADDTILFLDGTNKSISGSIDELTRFGQQSGLKINVEKTSCMAIGTLTENCVSTTHNINIAKELTILGIKIDRNIESVADNNIQLKTTSIKRELELWKRRGLTPIGRISIVKALILSKLVHFFISLPNPSTRCTKELDSLLFEFVWGKKDKIKRTKLVQNYSNDGLKMIHIDSFINSMKLSWLKRLYNSCASWKILAEKELPNVTQLLTYGAKKLNAIRQSSTNLFYVDLVNSLIKFNVEYKPSVEEIVSEKIWFCDWTKYKTATIKSWDDKGLRFIGDLYNIDSGNIYSKEELEQKYRIQMTFLCYESLKRSLPQGIRQQINRACINKPNIPYKINLVQNSSKFTKFAYKVFIEEKIKKNSSSHERLRAKWLIDVGDFIEGSVGRVAASTMSTYLIYLHFRIFHRIYATNEYLAKIEIIRSSKCSFCANSVESISHLFWQCPITQIFIKEVLSHLRNKYKTTLSIDLRKWFLLTDLSPIEVLLVTLIKSCIHKARLKSERPSAQVMMASLKFEAVKEYNLARKYQKTQIFEQRWGELARLLV